MPFKRLDECQAFGALIALDPHDDRVLVASENCTQILGVSATVLLNTPLGKVLGTEIVHALRNVAALPFFSSQPMALGRFQISERLFDASAFRNDTLCVLEIEPAYEGIHNLSSDRALGAIEYLTRVIESADTQQRLFADVAGYTRYLSGYTQVRVRALAGHQEEERPLPTLHHNIDAYAPIVFSVEDAHVPLCASEEEAVSLILSSSCTRAVSEADRALAAESGAVALMSVPLRVGERGWGVLSFENPSPRRPSPALRQVLSCVTPLLCRKLEALECGHAWS
ncbi:MAG: GAF domain-containing protein [Pseudomonadota bacterium]